MGHLCLHTNQNQDSLDSVLPVVKRKDFNHFTSYIILHEQCYGKTCCIMSKFIVIIHCCKICSIKKRQKFHKWQLKIGFYFNFYMNYRIIWSLSTILATTTWTTLLAHSPTIHHKEHITADGETNQWTCVCARVKSNQQIPISLQPCMLTN